MVHRKISSFILGDSCCILRKNVCASAKKVCVCVCVYVCDRDRDRKEMKQNSNIRIN